MASDISGCRPLCFRSCLPDFPGARALIRTEYMSAIRDAIPSADICKDLNNLVKLIHRIFRVACDIGFDQICSCVLVCSDEVLG